MTYENNKEPIDRGLGPTRPNRAFNPSIRAKIVSTDGFISNCDRILKNMGRIKQGMRIGCDAKRVFHNKTGLGNYGRDLIRILQKNAFIDEIFLYNTKPSNNFRVDIFENIRIRYPHNLLWKKLSSMWRLFVVSKRIKTDNLDIYHGLSMEIPIGLPKNIATVVSMHDLIFLSHPHYYTIFDRVIYKMKVRHAAHNANLIMAMSEQTKRDIIKYLKIDESKIRVVYQGCNAAYKKRYGKDQKEQVAKRYDLPKKFVLNVGTIQERKNLLTLVKAIHYIDSRLVVVGSEKAYAKKVHRYIEDHDLQDKVHFFKNVPVKDLAVIYQLATVFCYPSICEGFGIPIIEALFSGVPVITSEGGCFHEAGGPDSIYVDPKNNIALGRKLQRLLRNPKLRHQISKKGHEYAQRFSDEKIAHSVQAIYNELLNKPFGSMTVHPAATTKKITALLITYNEIAHIDAVLKNLDFADEIIVVDSFSKDGTIERIEKFKNVKLIQRSFKNYTDQKNFALGQASNDWILFLDADERLTPGLKKEVMEIVNHENQDTVAYYFYRTFMFMDKKLRFSGWQTDKNYRLFRKSKAHFRKDLIVHETLSVNGRSGTLKHKLIHYSYTDYGSYKDKMIKYGQMKALQAFGKGESYTRFHIIFRPIYKFFHHYIVRLGILDGKKGIIICYLNAVGVHARYKEQKRLQSNLNRS